MSWTRDFNEQRPRSGLVDCLKDFDFDANDQSFDDHIHGICNYPARMHPYVIRVLIEQFSDKNGVIYDPYCGSGTVLVESVLQGKSSVGIDINPLASLISKVKTTPISPNSLLQTYDIVERDLKQMRNNSFIKEIPFDTNEVNLRYWFKKSSIKKLSVIYHLLNGKWQEDFDKDTHDFLQLCFVRLIRDVSTVRKGEFKLYRESADVLKSFHPRVIQRYLTIFQENITRMEKFYGLLQNKDIDNLLPSIYNCRNESISLKSFADLVITSPPYGDNPTTITYGQYSRYPLLWLGFSKETVYSLDKLPTLNYDEESSIVNKSRTYRSVIKQIRNKDQSRAVVVETYFLSLIRSLIEISRSLKDGGKLCLIIGPRTVRQIVVPNHRIIKELTSHLGLTYDGSIERNISYKRLPLKNNNGETILKEHIMIMEKR